MSDIRLISNQSRRGRGRGRGGNVPYLGHLLASPGSPAPKRGATNQLTVGVVMRANIKSPIEHASLRPLQYSVYSPRSLTPG